MMMWNCLNDKNFQIFVSYSLTHVIMQNNMPFSVDTYQAHILRLLVYFFRFVSFFSVDSKGCDIVEQEQPQTTKHWPLPCDNATSALRSVKKPHFYLARCHGFVMSRNMLGAGENYENTMAAFKNSVALGTDMLELDVHLTKDELVVVAHDQNLTRCTGCDKNISELYYNDIPLLKDKLPLDFDQGFVFSGSGAKEDRKVPLLEEVFKTFPNFPINIDIKVNSDKLISEVSRLIKLHNREKYTVWGNFDDKVTSKCYKENPNVNLLFSMTRVIHLILLLYTGLLPFCPIKETHLEIFLPSVYLRTKPIAAEYQILYKVLVKIMDALLLRPSLFRHLKKRGIQTYVWVLNYEDEFKRAFDLGVDGVMTDYPSKLKKFLAENPQYSVNDVLQ